MAISQSTMHIACSADAPYLPHASATLHSLLSHTRDRPTHIWLVHGAELPDDGRALLTRVTAAFGVGLDFVAIPKRMIAGFSLKMFHPASWYRILLPELLPQLDRVLYLDSDVIVTDDPAPLWDTDLGGKLFGAVPNPLYWFMPNWPRRDLGLADPLDYLNSGVLLLDSAKMRADNVIELLREYSAAHPDNRLPEQDALSELMRGRWLRLHPRWNLQSIFYEYPPKRLPFPESVVREALARPGMIHFNGWFKPWQFASRHPRGGLYFEHLRHTPWPERPLDNAGFAYRLIRPLPLFMQYHALLRQPAWRACHAAVRSRLGKLRTRDGPS